MSLAASGTLLHLETRRLETAHGAFDAHIHRNLVTGGYAVAVTCGDVRGTEPVLARVHSSCVTSEVFGSCDCDCVEQLDGALAAIAGAGRGILFYLMQEGRGAGFTAKVRDRMIVQASGERATTFEAYRQMGLPRDSRSYEEIAFMLPTLDVEAPLSLLTGNPEKVAELEGAGVRVAGTVPSTYAVSPFNSHYLRAKVPATASGGPAAAALPEPVEYFEPHRSEATPGLVYTASYLLPIAPPIGARRRGEAHWFRLHAYWDVRAHHEWVVLTYGAAAGGVPLVRLQAAPLLARFPAYEPGGWPATVRAVVRHGSGCAIFRVAERDALDPPSLDDAPVFQLLAHHLGTTRARPVLDGVDGFLAAGLAPHGITLDDPLVLDTADAG